jgi:hypothetical protein
MSHKRRFPHYWDRFKKGELKMATMRTREQVNQDYGNTCAQIGEHVFRIGIMEEEVEKLSKRILALGAEMAQLDDLAAQKAPVTSATAGQPGVPNEAAAGN